MASAGRRWDLLGAAVGFLGGMVDLGLLSWVGVEMRLGASDILAPVVVFFALNFAALGAVAGRLHMARLRARGDAALIAAQLDALEASQRELLASQRELVHAEKLAAIGRLAAGVAHEVRNPLGVIRASASLVQEDLAPEGDGHRACAFIVEEIDRLEGMIGSLLKFARPERLELAELDPREALEVALALGRPSLEARGATLEVALADAPPVRADLDLLSQLIFGLLDNAAAVMDDRQGPRRALVSMEHVGDVVRIEVRDCGPGVPLQDEGRIFEPFFTTRPRGTGLGLAIAARIAQAHQGRLEVIQGRGLGPQGQGACFRLELPCEGQEGA